MNPDGAERSGIGGTAFGVDVQGDRPVCVRAEAGRRRGQVTFSPVRADDRPLLAASRGGSLAAALGPRESVATWVEVGFASRSKARKVLPSVLDIQLPFPLESCAFAFVGLAATADGKTRALGVAARLADVDRSLSRLRELGLDPAVLDHEGLALWTQSLREAPAAGGARRAVCYVGRDRATLVLGVGGDFRAVHAVQTGDQAQVRRLVRAVLGPADRPLAWYWAGPGLAAGHDPAADALLDALRQDGPVTAGVHREPAAFLARGLAARAVLGGALACNLRGGERTHPAVSRRVRTRAVRHAVAALASGLLLCVATAGVVLHARAVMRASDAAFLARARALAGPALAGARGDDALLIVRRRVDAELAALAPATERLAPSLTRRLAAAVAAAQAHGLQFEAVRFEESAGLVTGRGPGRPAVEALAAALAGEGLPLPITMEAPEADGAVPFTLKTEGRRE